MRPGGGTTTTLDYQSKTGNRHRDTDLSKGDTGDARQETRGMKHVGQTSRQNQRTRKPKRYNKNLTKTKNINSQKHKH